MLLIFTAIDNQAQFRNFSCTINSLEDAFSLLSSISQKGDHIIKADILDNGKRTQLPAEAFDGNSVSAPLRELENEWQQILAEPTPKTSDFDEWLGNVTSQQVKNNTVYMYRIRLAILAVEQNILQVQATIFREPYRSKLLQRYTDVLLLFHKQLETGQTSNQLLSNRLAKLADKRSFSYSM